MHPRPWRFRSPDPDLERELARALEIGPLAARVLVNRGPRSLAEARDFVAADIQKLSDPALFPDMPKAVDRLGRAIADGESILIHGDYDVDGLTGASLLYHFLREAGARVDVHIPERLRDGYGLSEQGVAAVVEAGPAVVVTVDHGISALEPLARLRAAGIDVIVTDHHQIGPRLPEAHSLIHPRLIEEDGHEVGGLSGAGVAFKLACAVFQSLPSNQRRLGRIRHALRDALAFAAMGTIADVVPLSGENRRLVRHGLERITRTKRPGLAALYRASTARSSSPVFDVEDVGFGMAPRLNAAGRMGRVDLAKRLLLSDAEEEARDITRELDDLNQQRREVEGRVFDRASELAAGREDDPVLCLADASFHVGVVGIVASRLVERTGKPVVLISTDSPPAKGSGRAPAGYDLAAAFRACSDVLLRHGGHAAAAGLEIEAGAVDAFRERLAAHTRSLPRRDEPRFLDVDAEVHLTQIDRRLVQDLLTVGPFGEGNRKPLFAASEVEHAAAPRRVGANEDHLLMKLRTGGLPISAIAFRQGDRLEEAEGEELAIVFSPRLTTFPGGPPVELLVQDLRSRRSPELENLEAHA